MRPGLQERLYLLQGHGGAQKDTGHPKNKWELICDQGRVTPFRKSLVLSLGAGTGGCSFSYCTQLFSGFHPLNPFFVLQLPSQKQTRNPGSGPQGKIIFREPVPVQVCLLGGSCLSDASRKAGGSKYLHLKSKLEVSSFKGYSRNDMTFRRIPVPLQPLFAIHQKPNKHLDLPPPPKRKEKK